MNTGLKYMIVDDDPISNMLSGRVIESMVGKTDTNAFTEPGKDLHLFRW
jgi:hypothetical protein